MKRLGTTLSLLTVLMNPIFAQSEAGAIFLLIAPGARAGGMGEAFRYKKKIKLFADNAQQKTATESRPTLGIL